MSFISELERLKEKAKNDPHIGTYSELREFLRNHADEIAELVKATENLRDVKGRYHTEIATVRLFDAAAALNKEKP